jgi:hypothetical protein
MGSEYRIEKQWEHAGCQCVVIVVQLGHRCGYVGIDKTHPLYGVEYYENPEVLQRHLERLKTQPTGERGALSIFCWDGESVSPEMLFNVHGSITYSGGGDGYPVESDRWFYGFDCAHNGDDEIGGRSLEYCMQECESLAEQLLGIEN